MNELDDSFFSFQIRPTSAMSASLPHGAENSNDHRAMQADISGSAERSSRTTFPAPGIFDSIRTGRRQLSSLNEIRITPSPLYRRASRTRISISRVAKVPAFVFTVPAPSDLITVGLRSASK